MSSLINWYGGKGHIVKRLLPFIPSGGAPYCEPFAGGLAVLLAREPARVEVVNDLDERIVHFYRTMQSKTKYQRLRHMLEWTPYSRSEFARALNVLAKWNETNDDVLKAWAVYVSQNFAVSGAPKIVTNFSTSPQTNNALSHHNRVNKLDAFCERLARVTIEHDDALKCIARWDTPDAVFYLDPPYHHETRRRLAYAVEADHKLHEQLVSLLLHIKGAATLSCYWHPVYQTLIDSGWSRVDFDTTCKATARTRSLRRKSENTIREKVSRVETLLINPRAQDLLAQQNKLQKAHSPNVNA